ncbi:MAG TPA: FAD-dependent oxidoreductase, partial [Sulfurovum sp.]|nr:FAD-dependent oxidoreductase [Sulfurovum sp.]
MRPRQFHESEVFDIAVIGAGVVGCAIYKEFCEQGAKTVLIESANDILEGASKGNSAILHTGFDAPPESLELECVKRGYAEYMKIKDELNLQLLNTKAMVIAWNDEQLEKLDAIQQKGFGNGVKEIEII